MGRYIIFMSRLGAKIAKPVFEKNNNNTYFTLIHIPQSPEAKI